MAHFAVESLDSPAARNVTLELGGPEALAPVEVVKIFEQVGGQPLEVQVVPVEALRAQYAASADAMQKSFAAMMIGSAAGKAIDMSETLKSFPVRLRSVHEYARQVLAQA